MGVTGYDFHDFLDCVEAAVLQSVQLRMRLCLRFLRTRRLLRQGVLQGQHPPRQSPRRKQRMRQYEMTSDL